MECCRKTKGASVLPTDAPWNSGSGDGGCQRDDTFHLPSADTVTYPCCGSRSTPFWSAAEVCRTICGAPFAGVWMTVPDATDAEGVAVRRQDEAGGTAPVEGGDRGVGALVVRARSDGDDLEAGGQVPAGLHEQGCSRPAPGDLHGPATDAPADLDFPAAPTRPLGFPACHGSSCPAGQRKGVAGPACVRWFSHSTVPRSAVHASGRTRQVPGRLTSTCHSPGAWMLTKPDVGIVTAPRVVPSRSMRSSSPFS